MKFALAFVLLIGISCQIGRGDCAPDGLYESLSGMVGEVYSVTQSTYHSVMDHLSPLTEYLPSPPDSLKEYLPSPPDSLTSYLPSVPDSLTSELSDMKESTESLASKTGDMLDSGLDSAEDLGSDTGDLLKSGLGKISDAVYD